MMTVPPETEQLARRVAAQSGKTPEQVVRDAVETEACLAGVALTEGAKPRKDIDIERVREITRRIASRPLLDPRRPREILDEAWDRRE